MDLSKSVHVCFGKSGSEVEWCNSTIMLCNIGVAQNITINVTISNKKLNESLCGGFCNVSSNPDISYDINNLMEICSRMQCNMADFMIPSVTVHGNDFGVVNVTYSCTNDTNDGVEEDTTTNTGNTILPTSSAVTSTSIPTTKNSTESSIFSTGNNTITAGNGVEAVNSTTESTRNTHLPTSSSLTSTSIPTTKNNTRTTESSIFSKGNNTTAAGTARFPTGSNDSGTVTIVVSVVVPIIVVVVVVAFLMYRRGQCKQLLGKCTKKYAKHSPDRTDTYAMSSEANANFTYDFSSDIDVSRSDVDYCEIDKVAQETGVEYNHVNLKQTQVAKDPTYNHIGHLNSSPRNTEQTYNLVGDETFQNTSLFTLQPDTYSHIGAMAKPASKQLAEDLYAHINGVKQYIPEVYDVNQYDCAVFQPNGGPTGHQERVMDSGKENTFNVVRPGTMDGNNEAPVSHSYFIVEKHEKEA